MDAIDGADEVGVYAGCTVYVDDAGRDIVGAVEFAELTGVGAIGAVGGAYDVTGLKGEGEVLIGPLAGDGMTVGAGRGDCIAPEEGIGGFIIAPAGIEAEGVDTRGWPGLGMPLKIGSISKGLPELPT